MVTQDALVSRLLSVLPQSNDQPAPTFYDQAVKDAVAAYSRRIPVYKTATISVLPDVDAYQLPADFLALVQLEGSPSGGLIVGEELTPTATVSTEVLNIRGAQLIISPTPTYTLARRLVYDAYHVLGAGTPAQYDTLGERDAEAVVLAAAINVLKQRAARAAGAAWSYSVGDERIDKSKLSSALWETIGEMERRYEALCIELQSAAGLARAGLGTSAGASSGFGFRATYE